MTSSHFRRPFRKSVCFVLPDAICVHMHLYALQSFQMKVVMCTKVVTHSYHIDLVKNELTDNIKEILPDLIDELSLAVPEYIPTKGSGALWVFSIRKSSDD